MNNRILILSFELPRLLNGSELVAGGVSTELLSWISGFRKLKSEIALFNKEGCKVQERHKFLTS